MARWLVVAAAANALTVDEIGVCFVRNYVHYDASRGDHGLRLAEFYDLQAVAMTLRRLPLSPRTCLFTEAPANAVAAAMVALGTPERDAPKLFDVVLEPSKPPFGGLGGRWPAIAAALGRLGAINASHGIDKGTRLLSRLSRLHDYARAPFEVTLFADDDAAFCPSTQFLGRVAALSGGADAPDVRIAEYDLAASDAGTAARHAGRLRRLAACAAARGTPGDGLGDAAWCWDHVPAGATACPTFAFASDAGLQAGVVVARNTSGARRFFGDWVDAYVDMWLPHLAKRDGDLRAVARVGSDQEPLWAIVKRRCLEGDEKGNWTLAALPPEFNARFLRPGRAAALDDDVLIVHDNAVGHYGGRGRHFDLRRWDVAALLGRVESVCAAANGRRDLRIVANFSGWAFGEPVAATVARVRAPKRPKRAWPWPLSLLF